MDRDLIKPYGDTLDDGMVQMSFTLPVENGAKARKAAQMYVEKLNFENVSVVSAKKIANNFTCFVVYARAIPTLDMATVTVSDIKIEKKDFYEINDTIKKSLKRRLSVVGATVGDDAHTVGIDAIMNMKGYDQDYGLERYPQIDAYNMGAQISCEFLIEKALEKNADAILVSQTVTQKDTHIRNFKELVEMLGAKNLRSRFLLIAGGSRVTYDFALELGYDAGFGPGTRPSHVATFLVLKLMEKEGKDD